MISLTVIRLPELSLQANKEMLGHIYNANHKKIVSPYFTCLRMVHDADALKELWKLKVY